MNISCLRFRMRLHALNPGALHPARLSLLAAGLVMVMAWTGCGNVYRPVEIPLTPAGPNPQQESRQRPG